MNDAPPAPDIASAASTVTTSPSFCLFPLCPGGEGDGEVEGEGEGLEVLSDSGVAVSNCERPRLPPPSSSLAHSPFSLSVSLSLVCCSQSASNRPENEAITLLRGKAQRTLLKGRRMKGRRMGILSIQFTKSE